MRETRSPQPNNFSSKSDASPCPAAGHHDAALSQTGSTAILSPAKLFLVCFTEAPARVACPVHRAVRRSMWWNLDKLHNCRTMRETRSPQSDEFRGSSKQASQNGASPCPPPARVNATRSQAQSTANCRQQRLFLACCTDYVPIGRHIQRDGFGVCFFGRVWPGSSRTIRC